MRVSVITPVRDGERYLAAAISSVLAGSVRPDEVVVVDDGSADGSAAVAASFGEPVKVIGRPPRGIAAAVNAGVAASTGELIGFVDADDLWTPDGLERRLGVLAEDVSLDGVFGRVECFHSPELGAEERAALPIPSGPQPFRAKGTLLLRRSALERVGPFDSTFAVGDFIDWYARADDAGCRFGEIEAVVLRRRYHRVNHTREVGSAGHLDYARLARAALERRRAASA